MSWLINSMTNEIGENFLFYGITKEIWDATKENNSSFERTLELFSAESIFHELQLGDSCVTQYFNSLKCQWQQLDLFKVHEWKCPKDEALYKQIIEKKRVFKFLIGLNKDLDEVCGRILGTKPLPNV